MDVTTKTFLAILKAALVGKQADLDREILPDEWQKLFHMASIHNVLPMFYEAVYASPSLQQANLPFLVAAKQQVRQQVIMQTMRTNEFLALNQQLQTAGIKPLFWSAYHLIERSSISGTSRIPCCRKGSKLCIPASRSVGETNGCFKDPIILSLTSLTPGAAQRNLPSKPSGKRRRSSIWRTGDCFFPFENGMRVGSSCVRCKGPNLLFTADPVLLLIAVMSDSP